MLTLYPNIMSFKHELEAKHHSLISNRDISRGSKVNHVTVGKLIKSDITLLYLSTFSKLIRYFEKQGATIELGDFFCWKGEELASNIGSLIARLDPVPTEEEVAEKTGIPLLRMGNLVKGNVKRIYLKDLAALLEFFRRRGVDIKIGNLLREEELE